MTFDRNELVSAGHKFSAMSSRGLASIIETRVSQWGLPTVTCWAKRAAAPLFAGLRYTAKARSTPRTPVTLRVYWQGTGRSCFETGAATAHAPMTLVYNCPPTVISGFV